MSFLHVGQVDTYLRRTYGHRSWSGDEDDDGELTRLLARFAVDLAAGASAAGDRPMLVEVGSGDPGSGVDAVGVDLIANHVLVVCAAWQRSGHGELAAGRAGAFMSGILSILDLVAAGPAPCSPQARSAIRLALRAPGGRLSLVVATTSADGIGPAAQQSLDQLLGALNRGGGAGQPIARLGVLDLPLLHTAITRPARGSTAWRTRTPGARARNRTSRASARRPSTSRRCGRGRSRRVIRSIADGAGAPRGVRRRRSRRPVRRPPRCRPAPSARRGAGSGRRR